MRRNALHVRVRLWFVGLKSGAIALDLRPSNYSRPFTQDTPLHIKFMVKCNDIRLTIKSSCKHPVFGPAFTPYRLFQWYPQSKEILLNLSMKCTYSRIMRPKCFLTKDMKWNHNIGWNLQLLKVRPHEIETNQRLFHWIKVHISLATWIRTSYARMFWMMGLSIWPYNTNKYFLTLRCSKEIMNWNHFFLHTIEHVQNLFEIKIAIILDGWM
jgi:hypothetical protein